MRTLTLTDTGKDLLMDEQLEKAINHLGSTMMEILDKVNQIGDGLEALCQKYNADRQVGGKSASLARPISNTPVNHKCPKCNAPMLERYNKSSGEMFYGCSKFPECRGTRQSDGSTGRNANTMRTLSRAIIEDDYYNPGMDDDVPF